MSEGLHDEQALLLLLKCPKKKYIKHLIEYGTMLCLNHNKINENMSTPIIKSFKQDMQLSTEQSHRLLLSISNLVQLSIRINFNFQKYQKYIFSQEFDEQLKNILISTITALQPEIEEIITNRMRMGNKLIDFDWKLDLQIANQRGKNNIPVVSLKIQSLDNQSNSQLKTDKIIMKGEQFMAFFGNLKKIKESLLDLVGGKTQAN